MTAAAWRRSSSLVGIVALIPYLVLQFKGLGIIVEVAGYGAIGSTPAIWIGAAVATAYVMVSGVRGSAWTAVAKDFDDPGGRRGLSRHLSSAALLRRAGRDVRRDRAGKARLHGACREHGESVWWFSSTVLLTALGFYMWPHAFGSIYTARSARVIRQNAVVLPLYQLILLFVFLVGLCGDPAGAGPQRRRCRSGVVQALGQNLRSVDRRHHRRGRRAHCAGARFDDPDDRGDLARQQPLPRGRPLRRRCPHRDHVAKLLVPVVALVAIYFTLQAGRPSWRCFAGLQLRHPALSGARPSACRNTMDRPPWAPSPGIVAGVATVAAVSLTHSTIAHAVPGVCRWRSRRLNVGLIALAVNFLVLIAVSAAMRLAPAFALRQGRLAGGEGPKPQSGTNLDCHVSRI